MMLSIVSRSLDDVSSDTDAVRAVSGTNRGSEVRIQRHTVTPLRKQLTTYQCHVSHQPKMDV